MLTLVIQSYGSLIEYRRALFSILSFAAWSEGLEYEIRVYTDQPEWFQPRLYELPVHYHLLTMSLLREMRGAIDFTHRIKIAVIEDAFETCSHCLLYVDSDAFFRMSPQRFADKCSPRVAFMHLAEYRLQEMESMPLPAGATFRAAWNYLSTQGVVLSDGRRIFADSLWESWNAGVMALHPDHRHLLKHVYAITEQLYPATGNHASEQYAFSIVLQQNTQLEPCSDEVHHYWYRIKKSLMDQRLDELFGKSTVPWHKFHSEVREMTRVLPGWLESHPLMLKDNSIQAFNRNDYRAAYLWAFKALISGEYRDFKFLRDIGYHTKRWFRTKLAFIAHQNGTG